MMRDTRGGGYQRVEVLTGPGRRRAWDEVTKARVVAESYAPEAVVSAVARRWQIAPQQLFTWRREARAASPEASRGEALAFAPIVADPPAAEVASSGARVEVVLAGAVVAELARRWQVCPQQVYGWRRERRLGTAGSASTPPPGTTRPPGPRTSGSSIVSGGKRPFFPVGTRPDSLPGPG